MGIHSVRIKSSSASLASVTAVVTPLGLAGNAIRRCTGRPCPPSFQVEEAEAYRRDVPDAEVHVIDAGHFALDEAPDVVADLTRKFLDATTNGVTKPG
jgi:hypothetical protein